jgi:hypothetical protein
MLDRPRERKGRRGAVTRGPLLCDHCREPEDERRVLLPIGPRGQVAAVHIGCYGPWLAAKRERGELPPGP